MKKLIIFHGSSSIIEAPEYGKGSAYNDYGRGFYCTEHIDLAKEWACSDLQNGYANKYAIDTSGLTLLDLTSEEYTVLNWLALLMENRVCNLPTELSLKAHDYLLANFLPKYKKYDIIKGYRADDSYFSFARAFLMNTISLKQLGSAMKLGKLGEQFVLKSKKAFEKIRFIDYEIAESDIYYPKRKQRDERARADYHELLKNTDFSGIYMLDIIREEIKSDDTRLR